MKRRKHTLTEKERQIIQEISTLSDKELFGLKCFLAGARVTVQGDSPIIKKHKQEVNISF